MPSEPPYTSSYATSITTTDQHNRGPSTSGQNSSPPDGSQSGDILWYGVIRDSTGEDLKRELVKDLSVKRINDIHKHLWWVGRPGNVNPLHRQKTMLRTIVITEKPILHLVWFDFTIFIKPLPEYLLDRKFFIENICSPGNEELYELACGFLLSYSKLIQYKSDHTIAIAEGLIPEYMDWPKWCRFSSDIRKIQVQKVNKRYRYGELRLGRLNQIYRFCKGQVRGFYTVHTKYGHFFQKNFGWLLLLFAFLTIILTGMQVVLATPQTGATPGEKVLFEDVSYVFGIVSIVIVVVGSFIALALFVVLFWWNLVVTLLNVRECRKKRVRAAAHLEAGKSE